MSAQDQILNLATEYRRELATASRPNVSEFLKRVSESQTEALLKELIPIDVKYRKRNGEFPIPEDYRALGKTAVTIASTMLETADSRTGTNGVQPVTVTQLDANPLMPNSDLGDFKFDPDVDTPPMEIGPYRLIEKIGSGGMGTVWLAQQEEPVRRRVALKLISSNNNDAQLIARFEAERQAVALMDHQNIARIFEAGKTNEGSPYFAMELVEGVKLNKYCDVNQLSIRQRIKLMIPVCMAIQHAHQKGILHRDLKHSNVLVTQCDGQPVPKIIDFGLAKQIKRERLLSDKTLNSEVGKIVGTIQYMSPEQANKDNTDVDTRTDVYSLGAMLYKLLAGSTPIKNSAVKSLSIVKLLEKIQIEEPELPSARLESSSSIDELARRRNTSSDQLKQCVKGDLDWIVAKTLDTDRERRYETVYGLAMDLQRYLDNEPVKARPPSRIYNIQKFVARNSCFVAATAAILCLLISGILGTSLGLRWALKERDRANRNSDKASSLLAEAIRAEKIARESDARREVQQRTAEARLRAIRVKSAWSDWQFGNTNFAWQTLNEIAENEIGWETQFLCTEFSSSKKTIYGNSTSVNAIDLSPDRRFLAAGLTDRRIKVWDAKTHQLKFTHPLLDSVSCTQFSPDSSLIAFGDLSNRITIFDVKTGEQVSEHGPFSSDVLTISFLGNEILVAGFAEKDTKLVRRIRQSGDSIPPALLFITLKETQEPIEIQTHAKDISGLAVSTDQNILVTCSQDETIGIWRRNPESQFKLTQTISGHQGGINAVTISPNNKQIASCGNDMTVRLWDLKTGKQIRTFVGHQDNVTDVCFSKNGNSLASASQDRTAKIWDVNSGELIRTCNGHYDTLNQVILFDEAASLYSASDDQTIRLWDASNQRGAIITQPHSNSVWQASVTNDGKTVISVSEDGKVAFTNIETGKPARPPIEIGAPVLCVGVSPVSETVVFAGDFEGLKIQATPGGEIKAIPAHQDLIWDLDFSMDGTHLVTASADNTARVWNTSDWTVSAVLEGHTGELGSARYSPNGRLIATSSDDTTIRIWDAHSYELRKTLEGHTMGVWRSIFSPDGSLLASSSYDGDIIIWNADDFTQKRLIKAHTNQIAGLCFSVDGSRIVSASDDHTAKIWETNTGIELFVLRDKGDSPIIHASFTQDGKRLISGDREGYLTIRTGSDPQEIASPKLPQDAIEFTIQAAEKVEQMHDRDQLQNLLRESTDWTSHFPSHDLLMITGVVRYRLGKFQTAELDLAEAMRLEQFQYGEPDLRPTIEGYLALAYHKNGKLELAQATLKKFRKKAKAKRWQEDNLIKNLQSEIKKTFGDRMAKTNVEISQR